MPNWGPIKRRELIAALRRLGFDGPYSGGKHQIMVRGGRSVVVPNPPSAEIGIQLLARVLRQAGVGREEWENA